MENLLSTTILIPIFSNGPIPPFPPLTGLHFDPNSAETVANVVSYMKETTAYFDGKIKRSQMTCVEEYGGGFFSPYTFKEKRAFISFPKSGNTWTRALVLAAFGMLIPFGSWKTTYKYHNPNMLNFSSCGCFLMQKDHDFSSEQKARNTTELYNREAIILIRNPFQNLILQRRKWPALYVNETLFIENEGNK